jgi:hypothetical protein
MFTFILLFANKCVVVDTVTDDLESMAELTSYVVEAYNQ